MKTRIIATVAAPLALALSVLFLYGCGKKDPGEHPKGHETSSAPKQEAPASKAGGVEVVERLRPVSSDKVCMVTDRVFSKPQIPVEVDGRTYYGCCEGCKATLSNDPRSRVAVDPVTGQEVDKAVASVAAYPDGRALYFASEDHRDAFNPMLAN